MGMFDSVIAKCPDCGGRVEFQSKAGDCSLAEYTPDNVPLKIMADIDGEVSSCQKCGRVLKFRIQKVHGIQGVIE